MAEGSKNNPDNRNKVVQTKKWMMIMPGKKMVHEVGGKYFDKNGLEVK